MPLSTKCEILTDAGWKVVSIDKVIADRVTGRKTEDKRCVICHGRVRAHKAGAGAAHFEHQQRNNGCPLSDRYDCTVPPMRHPLAID
jgi:hypothetical protein